MQVGTMAVTKKPKGLIGKFIPMLLMALVVCVFYWQETGLKNLAIVDEGPTMLTWKDDRKVWDKTSILYNDRNYTCEWTTYLSQIDESKTAQLCLHPGTADRGTNLVLKGVYKDCLLQTTYWDPKHAKQVYMEIGTHVGVCVLEMLLNTDATVVAVESHPMNLFALTSTLLANPKLLERTFVLPVALGMETTSIGAMELSTVGDYMTAGIDSDTLGSIAIARLDDILSPGGVQQVSLNVNGYECNVVDGGVKFFKKLPTLTFAVDPNALEINGCTANALLAKIEKLVTKPRWYRENGRLRPIPTKRMGFNAVATTKN